MVARTSLLTKHVAGSYTKSNNRSACHAACPSENVEPIFVPAQITLPMPLAQSSPLEIQILKKGLAKLSGNIRNRKDRLTAKLSRGETISLSDEQWLDNEGNTIDEERILDVLQSAPDYGKAVDQLSDNEKAIVKKLREWAGVSAKVAGKKRKCTHHHFQKNSRAHNSAKVQTRERRRTAKK